MDFSTRLASIAFDVARAKEPKPALVPAAAEHCAELARTLDPVCAKSIAAADGDNGRHKIEQCFVLATNRFSVTLENQVLCMFGTWVPIRARHLAEAGKRTPWAELWLLLGTNFSRAPFNGLKLIRHAVHELCGYYDHLEAHISASDHRMLRIADWLGGELEEPAPWGDKRELFRKFTVRR